MEANRAISHLIWRNGVDSGDGKVDRNPERISLREESYAEAGTCRGSSHLSLLSLKGCEWTGGMFLRSPGQEEFEFLTANLVTMCDPQEATRELAKHPLLWLEADLRQ